MNPAVAGLRRMTTSREGIRIQTSCASVAQSISYEPTWSGRSLSTLEGHTDVVNACTVTPDERRVVSASDDQTLKM
jgi:WD40 repeat protein